MRVVYFNGNCALFIGENAINQILNLMSDIKKNKQPLN